MLSHCQTCKYFHPQWCAVNPDYWKTERTLRAKLTQGELDAAEMVLLSCPHWELSTIPHSIPAEPSATRYSQRPLREVSEQHLLLSRQSTARVVRRKSFLQLLLNAAIDLFLMTVRALAQPWNALFVFGMCLLAKSDPLYPDRVADQPAIPQGYTYAQSICLAVIVYQMTSWVLAVRRGDFESAKPRSGVVMLVLALLTFLAIFKQRMASA